jgi:DNA-binding MarR family transcriptional regulator
LSVAQFTLLQALNTAPGMSQKQLAGLLEIDSTTLTRTLQPLRRAGWLRSTAGDDREVHLALTAAGKYTYILRGMDDYRRWFEWFLRRVLIASAGHA